MHKTRIVGKRPGSPLSGKPHAPPSRVQDMPESNRMRENMLAHDKRAFH